MKKLSKLSMKISFACFLFNSSIMSSQLTTVAIANANVGAVTNTGIVSLHIAGSAYKWNSINGLTMVGSTTNTYGVSGKTIISNDGLKIASCMTNPSTSLNEIALYDVGTSTWSYLGALFPTGVDGLRSSTWGMSTNANVIVGSSLANASIYHAVKWDALNGLVSLGSMIAGRSSRANAVNIDGATVAGWQDDNDGTRRPAKWVNGVESFITDTNGNPLIGEAQAVSADGNTIVGSNGYKAFIWKSTTGYAEISHPNASASFKGSATAISADGNTVIGYYRPSPGGPMAGEGFIWTPTLGLVNLNTYATSLNLNTQGVSMGLPLAISPDGTKIAGVGLTSTGIVTFYLDISKAQLSTHDSLSSNNSLSVYPNPVKDILYIKGTGKIEKAEVYNMVGQKLRSFDSIKDQIDVSSLSKGNYVLQVFTQGEEPQNVKFIKQ